MVAQLLGPDGTPITAQSMQALTQEVVTPSVTGVRQSFEEFVASGLKPARLASILREAATGDMHEFLTLAEEMEEREGQYASQLRTRKTAVKSIDPFVQPGAGDPDGDAIAEAVKEELIAVPAFRTMLGDMLDALGKGYSVIELIWATSASRWTIADYKWRDPRLFQFDRETRTTLAIRHKEHRDGLPLMPFKFITHMPTLKSGLPARNGLARIAVWHFMVKMFTLKDWATFIEVHGMPLRLGKYPQGSSKEDRGVLLRAVRDLGADAAAIIPDGMTIEFQETKGFSEKPFESLSKYMDAQLSKIILGQTMTADDGSSLAQATIHEKVRIDIKEEDAVAAAVTINRDVIRPWVDFNFGPRPNGRYPTLVLPVMEREDLKIYAAAIASLVDRGLEISQDEVRDRIGHRMPEDGMKLMRPARAFPVADAPATEDDPLPPPVAAKPGKSDKPALHRLDRAVCPGCGAVHAVNANDPTAEADALVAEALGEWEPVLAPIRDRIEQEARAATSYDDLDRRLAALAAELPTGALSRALAIMTMKARGLGKTNGPQAADA